VVLLLPHQLGGLEFTTAGAAAPLQRLRRCIAATVAAFEAEVGWQDHLLPAFAAPAEVDGDSAASIGINSNHNTAAPVERFAVAGAEWLPDLSKSFSFSHLSTFHFHLSFVILRFSFLDLSFSISHLSIFHISISQ
jgi:hypothetical protein